MLDAGTIGERVRLLRGMAGLRQDELAARAGISRTTVSLIEMGNVASPRAGSLARLARALDVPVSAIAGRPDGAPIRSPDAPITSGP